MEERDFTALAEAQLALVEAALEKLQDSEEGSWDYEIKPGGIIEIDCDGGGLIIINRHAAAREIWVAARSGGFHFKPPLADRHWRDTRSGEDLASAISRCMTEQTGTAIRLEW